MRLIFLKGPRLWRKGIMLLLALAVVWLLAGPLAGMRGNPVAMVTRVGKLLPVYSVDTGGEKRIAISFDACWGAEYTDQLLGILDQYGVKTTFFLVNTWLNKYPEKAKEILARGHELGMHSVSHPNFSRLSDQEMERELLDNKQMIKDLTGFDAFLFRPPFGDYNNRLIQTADRLGIKVIQWSIDSLDWKDLSADQIYRRVTGQMAPGAIVLFHNNGKYTAAALPRILAKLQADGYQIVPISQLLLQGNTYVDINGVQRQRP